MNNIDRVFDLFFFQGEHMARRWCVNFDAEAVLQHGLAEAMWLMQYQYSHGGYDYQGHPRQIAATARNWNILRGIEAGDWFVAYLSSNTFYAVGEVIEPRSRERHSDAPRYTDSIDRTVRDHCHQFFDGVVRYSEAELLYEDFTDTWTYNAPSTTANQPSTWQYPQRIDVREWEHAVTDGVLALQRLFPDSR